MLIKDEEIVLERELYFDNNCCDKASFLLILTDSGDFEIKQSGGGGERDPQKDGSRAIGQTRRQRRKLPSVSLIGTHFRTASKERDKTGREPSTGRPREQIGVVRHFSVHIKAAKLLFMDAALHIPTDTSGETSQWASSAKWDLARLSGRYGI